MGCDIHGPYLEQMLCNSDGEVVWNFVAKFDLSRNYFLFSLLANVRSYGDKDGGFEPKGMPLDISYQTKEDYTLFVCDKEEEPIHEEGYASNVNAERWVREGSSFVWQRDEDGKILRISGPDWHSANWLSSEELSIVLKKFVKGMKDDGYAPEKSENYRHLKGMLSCMKELEKIGGPCRIVFYFDN